MRLVATGICHADAIVRDQWYPAPLPAVLGHQGAGIMEKVGSAGTGITPDDRLVLSFASRGACAGCNFGHPAYCTDFALCHFGGARPEDGSAVSYRAVVTFLRCAPAASALALRKPSGLQ